MWYVFFCNFATFCEKGRGVGGGGGDLEIDVNKTPL